MWTDSIPWHRSEGDGADTSMSQTEEDQNETGTDFYTSCISGLHRLEPTVQSVVDRIVSQCSDGGGIDRQGIRAPSGRIKFGRKNVSGGEVRMHFCHAVLCAESYRET